MPVLRIPLPAQIRRADARQHRVANRFVAAEEPPVQPGHLFDGRF
jgi:hypothetical protein